MVSQMEIDLEALVVQLRAVGPKRILLQVPAGLRRRAAELADRLSKGLGCEVVISGDSCFGACDLPAGALKDIDAVVQVGHAPMSDTGCSVPTFFIRLEIPIDLEKKIASALHHLKSPIGLLATSQHLSQLAEAKRLLESHGCDVKIGSGSDRIAAPGHMLGCDFSSARDMAGSVSSFLLLGGGRFHSIGVKLVTKKPVVILDPERSEAVIEDVDIEAFLRKRHGLIQRFAEAKTVGVIVSTKPGQRRDHLAEKLKRLLMAKDRKAYLLLMDEISPEKLKEIGLDAYVSTACPRIALDDSDAYDMPIATPNELLIALEMLDWDDYTAEEFTHPGRPKRSE